MLQGMSAASCPPSPAKHSSSSPSSALAASTASAAAGSNGGSGAATVAAGDPSNGADQAGVAPIREVGTSIIRVDVDFELRPKSFSLSKLINNHIGRQAHVEFIESGVHARFLVWGVIRRYKLIMEGEPEHTWV